MKVGALAVSPAVSIAPGRSLREAARLMVEHGIGSTVILDGEALVGILTERDLMRAMAANADLDGATVADAMTRDVVTVGSDWEVYEATAEMAGHHIRHVVVCDQGHVRGVLSVRDVLLAGQRVGLTGDHWAVLRDPITFTIRERRRLQHQLLTLRASEPSEFELGGVLGLLVGSWSFDIPLPADAAALQAMPGPDRERLRAVVIAELPDLQRAIHPSPGWRRR